MGYQRIEVAPLTAALGAEVTGVDLRRPLDAETRAEVEEAWLQHLVLFFRDQTLSMDEHLQLALQFGEIYNHPVYQPRRDEGRPEIFELISGPEQPYVAERWHTDITFEPEPPKASVLRGVEVPAAGGDTMWANMYAAYEALSDRMQRLLSGLRAIHEPGFFYQIATPEQKRHFDERPPVTHPVVRTHPVTGRKGLFVNETFTRAIEGMKEPESQALLGFLYRHIDTSEFHVRFHWTPDALAIWDNRCTQHRVVADRPEARRVMQRLTLAGDRPV